MFLAPEASLQDGLLDVVTISDMPKLRYLRLLPTVFRGQHVRRRDVVEVRRTTQLEISADRPFTMYADGDPIGEMPLRVRALTGAVEMIVPRNPAVRTPFGAPAPQRATGALDGSGETGSGG
jgi:diacylglycerol kinase family enzyme